MVVGKDCDAGGFQLAQTSLLEGRQIVGFELLSKYWNRLKPLQMGGDSGSFSISILCVVGVLRSLNYFFQGWY